MCQLKGEGPSEDPAAGGLHPEALSLYRNANSAYREVADRYYEKICINSGKRTVAAQVELYRAHRLRVDFGIGGANPAANPGYSTHEYGVAIDIVRGTDEHRLRLALDGAGWSQHEGVGEAHHFDAKGVPSWNAISRKRAEILADHLGLKDVIVEHIRSSLRLKQLVEKTRAARTELSRAKAALRSRQVALGRLEERLAAEVSGEADLRTRHLMSSADLASAQAELSRLTYAGRCPNGHPYESCDHKDVKAAYRAEREAKSQKIRSLQRETSVLNGRLLSVQQRISRLRLQLDGVRNDIAVHANHVSRLTEALNGLQADLSNERTEAKTLQRRIDREADAIQRRINAYLAN